MSGARVFYAISQSPNAYDLPGSQLWNRNFYPALRELGCEVIPFEYDLTEHFVYLEPSEPVHQAFIDERRPELEDALLEQVRRAHRDRPIDLFFSYFYSACVTPSTIREIKSLGIPTVNFYCNAAHQFHLVADIAPHYDWCMVPEEQALAKYRAVGANPIHIQMAATPSVYKPVDVPMIYDVTFVGQRYLNRAEYVGYLYANGVDMHVWGPRWRQPAERVGAPGRLRQALGQAFRHSRPPGASVVTPETLPAERCGPPLDDEALIRMYSQSRISLGMSEVEDPLTGERKRHIRLRDFEAPMSGALYMTAYQVELENYFDINREVVCYHTKEDLLDKVRFFLAHEDEAHRVRAAGLARARRDHTWANRFRDLFAAIGLVQEPA